MLQAMVLAGTGPGSGLITDSAHRAERPIIPAHLECAPYRERSSGPKPDRHSTLPGCRSPPDAA
jgi:hypothetical protein